MNEEAAKVLADEETNCVIEGDCLTVMPTMDDACVDAIVTDPPYGLGFMGKDWDHGVPGEAYWREALRVAKPGCMMLAFGGTRTVHRLTCAIEDAGWEIRDRLLWMYGCLSEDTEIMVDGRWEPYHKAIAGRHALCYNAEHGTYSWQPIQDLYVYDYCDTAFRIQSDSTDQVVSRSHRCLVERGGRYMFQLAEEAAREHQASVPVLEGLQGLLDDLPVPRRGTGNTKKDVQPVLCCDHSEEAAEQNADGRTGRHEAGYLPGVRPEGLETASVVEARCQADVFSAVQRGLAGQGICQARPQGPGGMDGEVRGIIQSQDERRKQSSMEGWGDVLSEAWQLQANQVCTLPEAVPPHGTQGRLCYGAPVVGCSGHRAGPEENRSGASYRPRSAEQRLEQPATLCVESGAQTVRGARYTRASLARITPVFYRGIVWCVRVPTGAFVARRNGKVFVTGNSGFPKSLDISKAIDKAAGAEREVMGMGAATCEYIARGEKCPGRGDKNGRYGETVHSASTAPATDAAKRWAGWGTALKPAHEIIICAQKPLSLRGLCGITAHKIGASLCQLRLYAKDAGNDFTSNPAAQAAVGHDFALWPAVEKSNTLAALCEAMAMWPSESEIPTSLSIALSWLNILAAICSQEKTYTTETVTGLTTDLRTLNCSPSAITPESIIRVATGQHGIGSSASLAVSTFTAVGARLDCIRTRSAHERASLPEKRGLGLSPNSKSIILAMKPCDGTFAHNALTHGVAGLNVDGCRIGVGDKIPGGGKSKRGDKGGGIYGNGQAEENARPHTQGRWPANLILDEEAGAMLDEQSGEVKLGGRHVTRNRSESYGGAWPAGAADYPNDTGGASRFFYCAKASKDDREAGLEKLSARERTTHGDTGPAEDKPNGQFAVTWRNSHPTVKPTELMRYLCRLVTPPNGVILDPFCGSGSTGKAARRERFRFIGIELEAEYAEIVRLRIGRTKLRRQTFF